MCCAYTTACCGNRAATANSVAGFTDGMSPGRISHPPASGLAATPPAIEKPMPSVSPPCPVTAGRSTMSRWAT